MKRIMFLFLLLPLIGYSQDLAVRAKQFNLEKRLALQGYDPISYFDGKPLEGEDEFEVTHQGITYRFANANNVKRFKESPDKYEPAYGGWCAYAMGNTGEKVKIDPETYKIQNGKLYLFYNFWGNNTLTDWNKNEQSLKTKADQNWKKIVQ